MTDATVRHMMQRGTQVRRRLTRMVVVAVAILEITSACGQTNYEDERRALVETLRADALVAEEYGAPSISEDTLAVIGRVPRHEFVPEAERKLAYQNHPLPIGAGQTISQPYIVALMTELAEIGNDETVLEIGTGSGYQAAVLAEVARQVYTVEIVEMLGQRAKRDLSRLGYANVAVRIGDGYEGWPEHAPFDAILVTAAPEVGPAAADRPTRRRRPDGHSGWGRRRRSDVKAVRERSGGRSHCKGRHPGSLRAVHSGPGIVCRRPPDA